MSHAFWLWYMVAIFSVGAILFMLARLGRWLRSRGRGRTSRLRAVESIALGPNAAVHLIAIDGREFVVVTGGSAVSVAYAFDSVQ